MRRSNFPSVVVVDAIATFAAQLANATAGTRVLDRTPPGSIWEVGLNGTTKTLFQLDSGASLSPWATRTTTFVATPGAPASGAVAYAGVVSNATPAPVPQAVIQVGIERTVGAGAIGLSVTVGTLVSLIESGADIIATIVASGAGAWGFTVVGTPADTIETRWATDAPTGGVLQVDAGRVLP